MAQTKIKAGGFDADVITGTTALAAVPADTDELLISDAGTMKRIDFTHLKTKLYPDNVKYFTLGSNATCSADATTDLTGWGNPSLTARRLLEFGTTYVSHSSGVFTFSTEGYYHVAFRCSGSTAGASDSSGYIFSTTDNSAYADAVDCNFSKSGGTGFNFFMDGIFSITDTSNHKIKFGIYAATNNVTAAGNTTRMRTYCRFIRIGTAA
jgi:hypothetical protein